ncbi:hypothetical protein CN558_12760 [Bacillus wiedmannii]|uniref:Uncharacterized protein n=2 Tax=Bacillus wiedmannii TaxID=1890302 RepID=A0A2A8CCK3_9BACI|nr:hypothetical protein [Bacillus wiedmannii]PEJ99991.1 hypothetical protein CN690_16745 [Bacillus wiedmannii]PEL75561.1 hypothetical protein CN609_27715 [Bacillus wiedmannii]PEM34524.1 hypothetical protein CN598_00325 [Bacillus wiedmannii]PEM81541.1 hypothetical protein CN627_28490 [Bacillus wiedmannii]PEO86107.1 hypothetical protein CN558_12760 [Bacillus wiedmannii]
MIVSNGSVDIGTKRHEQELAMKRKKQALNETTRLTWVRTTQSFLIGAILHINDEHKEQRHLFDLRVFIVQGEKKGVFLEYITSHLEKAYLSYHTFQIMLAYKKSTRALCSYLSWIAHESNREVR